MNSQSFLNFLLKDCKKLENLEKQFEAELVANYQETMCKDSLDKLVRHNTRYILKILASYPYTHNNFQEYFNEAVMGFIRAVQNYDIESHVKLCTFSAYYIKSFILEFSNNKGKSFKTYTNKIERAIFWSCHRLHIIYEDVTTDDVKAIAKDSGQTITKVEEYLNKSISLGSNVNLDAPLPTTKMNEITTLQELYEDANFRSPEDILVNITSEQKMQLVANALDSLNDRQREVIEKLFMNEETISGVKIGKQMGISAERVRQIKNDAFAKIKSALSYEQATA